MYDYLVIDTETTGLNVASDELLQVSIVGNNGEILYDKYIKPIRNKRWDAAERIHHISPEMVETAPTIEEERERIQAILEQSNTIIGYNVYFDLDFIEEAGIKINENQKVFDVMLAFAEIYGEYNEYFGDYKWQKLSTCADYYGYEWSTDKQHNSAEDCLATLFCYKKMMND